MSKVNVAINGFGRIGRLTLKAMLKKTNINLVAINDLGDTKMLAHLFKYDTVHGVYPDPISYTSDTLRIDSSSIKVFNEKDPQKLPWKDLGVDIVVESTGRFLTNEKAGLHIKAGAKKVITTAPLKDNDSPTIVFGINENTLTEKDNIISNASCTTNCLAPMVKVLNENFGINSGYINTIHAYTSDQNLHDAPHSKDFRRARAAAASIIPTTTGAAKAVGVVIPEMLGKLDGIAMRVPVINGSVIDFTVVLKTTVEKEDINNSMNQASKTELKNILQYTDEPIVSADIIGNTYSCIFDSELTHTNKNLVKVIGWYDNESGYSYRVADLTEYLIKYI